MSMEPAVSSNFNCDIDTCGSLCCRNCPVLTRDEVEKLIADVREEYGLELVPGRYFRRAKGEHGTYFAVKMIRGQCIFLDKEKRCRIYRCRPLLCELYPATDADCVDIRCPLVSGNKIPDKVLDALKIRYAGEVDKRIRMEHTFRFED